MNFIKTLISLSILFCVGTFSFAQNSIVPDKITIYKDGGEVVLKGILRIEDKVGKVEPGYKFREETIQIAPSTEYKISYVKMANDTLVTTGPASSWFDVLLANKGRKMAITFEIANEYDEIQGEVLEINKASDFFIFRNLSGNDLFIPLSQVQQVRIDSSAIYMVEQRKTRKVIEIKLNKTLPLAPVAIKGVVEGIHWIPSCKIMLAETKAAKYVLSGTIINDAGDFNEVSMELAGSYVIGNTEGGGTSSSKYDQGKTTLKNGDRIFVSLHETKHEYKSKYSCHIPWTGIGPATKSKAQDVVYSIVFTNPVIPEGACNNITVFDHNQNILDVMTAQQVPAGGIKGMDVNNEPRIEVTYAEIKKKDSGKSVKIGDKTYNKIPMEGKITVVNKLGKTASITVSRNLFGEITDLGSGVWKANETNPNDNKITWRISAKHTQKKTLTYQYEALIPVSENK